jgi:hypothetical protein
VPRARLALTVLGHPLPPIWVLGQPHIHVRMDRFDFLSGLDERVPVGGASQRRLLASKFVLHIEARDALS